jgi:uncharacterized protein YbgA (DUF1722 family)/uncharacterized protein YbbK (DUF523 family)
VPRRPSPRSGAGEGGAGGPIRVGISSCLLGQEVRYDGGHKRDRYITDTLGLYFSWVPVCPEFELGLGVPRETLRLTGEPGHPRLVFRKSGADITEKMAAWAATRAAELARQDLAGYILKSDSPSCGMERVKVHRPEGPGVRRGVGLFARALMEAEPLLPIEEEGRLHDPGLRENFVERVFCYRRWHDLIASGLTRARLVAFHAAHKLLLMAHSPRHSTEAGRLVGSAGDHPPAELRRRYGEIFMAGLRVQATARKHTNVLHHVLGYLKRDLEARDKAEALSVIDEYHRGMVPLIVPLTLLRHHLGRIEVPYINDQVYLNPHPRELMLRNHV